MTRALQRMRAEVIRANCGAIRRGEAVVDDLVGWLSGGRVDVTLEDQDE
jgi:hypothetical protein